MAQAEAENALQDDYQQAALLGLLANSLILCQTAPYLEAVDILNLGAASRAFRFLVLNTPQVFRRLDLTKVKAAQLDDYGIDRGGERWRNVQLDENLTEDDFYSGPLRGIFSSLRRLNILSDVQILILDGLSVTAEFCHELINDPSYAVRILSVRDAKNLNERKLRQALQYACRPDATPKLRGMYVFGAKTEPSKPPSQAGASVAASWNARSQHALVKSLLDPTTPASVPQPPPEEGWYERRGRQFSKALSSEWAATLLTCSGKIAFDAVLCSGPRHLNSPAWGKFDLTALQAAAGSATSGVPHWSVATHALGGCAGCGSAPEGWTVWGEAVPAPAESKRTSDRMRDSFSSGSPEVGRFPLLAPSPTHSANIKSAMCPRVAANLPTSSSPDSSQQENARFIPRCMDCIRERYCAACHRWWCESCYMGPYADGLGSPPTYNVGNNHPPNMTPGATEGGSKEPTYKFKQRRVFKSCWECGMNCPDCIEHTQLMCRLCGGGYCLIHNEGSNLTTCDWCSGRGRHVRELY